MSVLATSKAFVPSPVSPELILVSPPEVASHARAELELPEISSPPIRAEPTIRPRKLELAAVYLFCLFLTLGPLLFTIVLSDPVQRAAAP